MNRQLFVATAVAAGLLAAGTAMATPMAHERGGLRTERVIAGALFPGFKVTDPSHFWDDTRGGVDADDAGHNLGGFREPPPSDRGISSVPEPSTLTLALLAMGLTGLAVARRRRRRG